MLFVHRGVKQVVCCSGTLRGHKVNELSLLMSSGWGIGGITEILLSW